MSDPQALLAGLYDAFNRRDIEAVLARLDPEVAWPNGWEGGVLHGREAVRDYWTRQWAAIDPSVTPTGFDVQADGRVLAHVHQVIRTLAGDVRSDGHVQHVYAFRDGLISAMEIRAAE